MSSEAAAQQPGLVTDESAAGSERNTSDSSDSVRVPKFSSYQAFLETYLPPSRGLNDLKEFIQSDDAGPSNVTILDYGDDDLLQESTYETYTPELTKALQTRLLSVRTRVVLCRSLPKWSSEGFNQLGIFYNIPLSFLCKRVTMAMENLTEVMVKQYGLEFPLPSEAQHNEFHLQFLVHSADLSTLSFNTLLSCYISQDPKRENSTIVCWQSGRSYGLYKSPELSQRKSPSIYHHPREDETIDDYETGDDLSRIYLDHLLALSKNDISIGNACPQYYFLSLIRAALVMNHRAYRLLYGEHNIDIISDLDVHFTPEMLQALRQSQSTLVRLQEMRFELKRTLKYMASQGISNQREDLMEDLNALISDYETLIATLKERRSEDLTDAQMRETRASTEVAITVNRLSKLAFVFIPLSFVTSFFGMNLIEFGQGKVRLWAFFATAIVVCTVCVAFISPSMLKALRRSGVYDAAKISFRLLMTWPTGAYYYLGLCLHFDTDIVRGLLPKFSEDAFEIQLRRSVQSIPPEEAARRMELTHHSGVFLNLWRERADSLLIFANKRRQERNEAKR